MVSKIIIFKYNYMKKIIFSLTIFFIILWLSSCSNSEKWIIIQSNTWVINSWTTVDNKSIWWSIEETKIEKKWCEVIYESVSKSTLKKRRFSFFIEWDCKDKIINWDSTQEWNLLETSNWIRFEIQDWYVSYSFKRLINFVKNPPEEKGISIKNFFTESININPNLEINISKYTTFDENNKQVLDNKIVWNFWYFVISNQSYLDKIINNNYYQEKEWVLYSYDNIFTTWIKSIDNNIKIFSKELILIASYPIEISTNFLLNLYINKFNEGENWLFISNNMVKEKMIQKVLNIFWDKIWVDDIEQLWELKNSEFHDLYEIWDGIVSSMLLNSINYKEITNHIDETTSFIMIDNIQTYSNSEKEYNDFIKFLKELAVKYNLTIFISSSIPLKKIESRHNKIPTMGDLVNYSESLVNLTNLVITLYKEEYYDEFTDRKWIIDVFINNSQKTKIELFDKNGRFFELVSDK